MAGTLIIYYSRAGENYVNGSIEKLSKGNTEICAEFLQKAVGGDLFRIETVKDYAEDYYACVDEARKEWQEKARPELKRYLTSLAEYDTIFICGPCWCGTFPMAVYGQLERLDWKGKKVMVLVTHEGSGLGACVKETKRICTGASFGRGLAVHGADAPYSEKTIAAWAAAQK